MPDAAEILLNLLDLEELDRNLYRGIGSGGETPTRIYGGQVIAQALMAAYSTVEDRLCHSLHAYFIRPGDPSKPVIYAVDPARDGGSFTTRRVTALQNGKQILNLAASFHIDEPGWQHQHEIPEVQAPDTLVSRDVLLRQLAPKLDGRLRVEFTRERPFEIRDVEPRDPINPDECSDINHMWVRMKAAKGAAPQLQHVLMAYVSDYGLLGSALRPHGLSFVKGQAMTASLDHAMWFHAPVQFDNWHLYTMDSPFAGGGRGFNRGSIFTQDGQLVASVAQEGLMRPISKP
ncbi:acyl-CoA thioesterase [Phaeobacter gallaeciensis]|uniref:Acyl-CoA thioesterase 2 n=1 Tax=Phaeobacter gallaeciensis TaxID=60890 RepID=A0AAD0EBD4_9RHOB|nr:acyl-CoA thioesterase II [Phaeobacter gallaeciensis]AHD09587.1 Acyl-CoA thioesterase [Phaeobacter gallaeciensis DSM 26640]ATE92852.1 acyl-CoA thioesterase II [Phaeobacter gallaeciensis]ATE97326.1 acyl-CoA thioesterase II [Phaeobacter gallaeciensis]ATF01517.1 acyl-CoA thioesterase II [Phaeobacter gallaeciensis]ATF05897.1 acyl-CoA thioesterase II [Phaeobacter gallaeciensis]